MNHDDKPTLEEWMAQELAVADELREARRLLEQACPQRMLRGQHDSELINDIEAFLTRTSRFEQQETSRDA